MLEGFLYKTLEKGDGCAQVQLLPESPIYAAHFPGFPVTPGVTLVQMALELMGKKTAGRQRHQIRGAGAPFRGRHGAQIRMDRSGR
jgi:3-hydroxymyristoyl/3-hydroxydecanoyl-(acyl carrier protein) dehydratase